MDDKNCSFPDLHDKVKVFKTHSFYRVSDVVRVMSLAATRILENVDQHGESLLYLYLSSNGMDSELNVPLLILF